MDTSNFGQALSYERSRQSVADELYRSLGAIKIERHDYNNGGRDMQRKGIDATVYFSTHKSYVSEKFKSSDVPGLFVELETNGKDGWSLTDESNTVCVISPTTAYAINTESLRNVAKELKYKWLVKELDRFNKEKLTKEKINVDINGREYNMSLIRTDSNHNGRRWQDVGVFVKFVDLQALGVKIKRRAL